MAPILYKNDISPPANTVRMLADIIGLELQLKDVNFSLKEHKSPEYLKINPLGTFPTLVDDDFVVTDSHAIMIYLLSKYGADKAESLYPSDLRTRTIVNQLMFFNTGVYFIRIREVSLPTLSGNLTGPTEQNKQGIEEAYSVLETYLQNRKYVAADHLTIADLAVVTTTNFLQYIHKLDSAKFPRFANWLSRMEQESFCKKIFINTEIVKQLLNAAWENNKQKIINQ